ncbi:hypothetical protein ABK040_004224 [Willaertia magna]
MKSITILLTITFLCIIGICFAKYEGINQLQVGVKFRPHNCERKVKDGDTVDVHYSGTLTDGTEFDSSYKRNTPFTFTVGAGMVIQGWDAGLQGACVGEKRKLVIPPHLGYGSRKVGSIPENSVLIFDVEVMKIAE